MFSAKYLVVVALLVFCLFCQEAVEAHFLGKVGQDVHKVAQKVDKVAKTVEKARGAIAVGTAVAGIIGGAAAIA
ncbi:uncharacterized protein LOC128924167 [Zeugodacus cucurbitae]|uniref:uncharacterized protein LOC128924167 n=1 Tax=Zeugodacus cucurbitae TaxID=28588 RepID=UPI0023D94BB2|nr:uncharacterized protein LOC128924167 [Zeugodacus cucurbitae]